MPTDKQLVNQLREESGQFGHGFEAMCKCGRNKGVHNAERPFPFEDYALDPDETKPDCPRFRKARTPK